MLLTAVFGSIASPLLTGCGVRVDDFGPAETLTPDAAELARRAVSEPLQSSLRQLAELEPLIKSGSDTFVLVQQCKDMLATQLTSLGSKGGSSATDAPTGSSTPTPSATPTPTASAEELVNGIVVSQSTAITTALGALDTVSGPYARRLSSIAAGGTTMVKRWLAVNRLKDPGTNFADWVAAIDRPDSTPSASPTDPASASGPATGSPTDTPASQAELSALGALLAGCYAASYGYQVLAVRLRDAERTNAERRIGELEALGDELAGILAAAKADVPSPEPGYALPFEVTSRESATRLAGQLESGLSDLAGDALASSSAGARMKPAEWMMTTAVLASSWSGTLVALPGSSKAAEPSS
ncbi:DUF4439 domain-containing protein [Saxibacter everestensis]|uniref:DUF4439 domain-containing protein n=1 Tax=Saxibacter everestensis TaxID=2909229 RepID=A0ABY8QVT9_9MICO|nr:DUF4439 domain-containing protein [Brevibacteriaceae bacterium ZFBP1038]